MSVLILLVTIVILYISYKYIQFQRKFGHLRKIFPSATWDVIKAAPRLIKIQNGLSIANEIRLKNSLSMVYFFPQCHLLINEKNIAEVILNSNFDKTKEYSYHDIWLKQGLLTTNYADWKEQKRLLLPAFNIDHIQTHVKIFNEKAQILCEKLSHELENPSVDIHHYVMLCTLDVILGTTIDANLNVQENPTSDYMTSIKMICKCLYYHAFFSNLFHFGYLFSPYYQSEKRAGKILNNFAWKFIQDRRSGLSTSSIRTLLDIILENENISDEEVRAQLNTFIFAGHETTGATICYALFTLSKHPEIQNKVYEEIIDVIGKDNEPTYKDLMDLPYMTMVLMEVLRQYPAVPLISRQITKPINWNGSILPEGLSTFISIYGIHRDPECFPDPDKFDPERFNEVNIKKIPQFAYMPFSIGARNCIGQKFAMLEMKSILVNVLRRYKIVRAVPEHNLHMMVCVTFQSFNGIKIGLQQRQI